MPLYYTKEVEIIETVEADFFAELRKNADLIYRHGKEHEDFLADLRTTLLDLDRQLAALCTLRPELTSRYCEQHDETEDQLAAEVKARRIIL